MPEVPPPSSSVTYPPQWELPTESYTPWFTRVQAFVIDWTPVWLVSLVPMLGLLAVDGKACFHAIVGFGAGYCTTVRTDIWLAVQAIGYLLGMAYFFWNFCYRQGNTGQSIGKSMMKFKVVNEKTWQPIGFWASLLRQIAHYADQLLCFVGYLVPLWDRKRQTIADKIMKTVCVPLDAGRH